MPIITCMYTCTYLLQTGLSYYYMLLWANNADTMYVCVSYTCTCIYIITNSKQLQHSGVYWFYRRSQSTGNCKKKALPPSSHSDSKLYIHSGNIILFTSYRSNTETSSNKISPLGMVLSSFSELMVSIFRQSLEPGAPDKHTR